MASGPPPLPAQPNLALAFASLAFLGVSCLAMLAGHQPETALVRGLFGSLIAAVVGGLAGFVWHGVLMTWRDLHKGGEIDAVLDEDIVLPPLPPREAAPPATAAAPASEEGPGPTLTVPEAPSFAPIDYKQAAKQIQGMLKDGPGGA